MQFLGDPMLNNCGPSGKPVLSEQNDVGALAPMLAQIKANTGRQTRELSADTATAPRPTSAS